ncbi:MAG: glycosyltransferase, partial [Lachnospiraceae bacterium]|nr:glycosyltransferase [Lachnospiraceae bacterium]
MTPEVSIIVPVYKVPEKYLRKCLDSCVGQTLREVEIIIVYDFAEDNCGEICDEYARADKRIKVIHKKEKVNSGLSAARNTGVENASGKWITFVDGDDWIEPETCEVLLESAKKYSNNELVMCAVCKDYGDRIEQFHAFEEGQELSRDELLENVLNFNSWIACAYAKLINREHLIENNIFHDSELKQGVEGLEFNVRLFNSVERAIFVKKWLYHYMYNDESLSVNLSEKTNQLLVVGYKKIEKSLISYPDGEQLLELLYDRIQYSVISAAIRCYFNKNNEMSDEQRVQSFEKFTSDELISESIAHNPIIPLSISRKVTMFCIRHKIYFTVKHKLPDSKKSAYYPH